jgi:D-beta-D-heptose 7-phosphate kinase/D-beta-D-heptose 1-phosphate adenosyltransferase
LRIGEILDSIQGLRVVVVGDLMLDEYIFGSVNRISPEAPVPIVAHKSSRSVPGGAANVAKNAAALGAEVIVVGLVGEDDAGRRLEAALREIDGVTGRLVPDPDRPTTRKMRVIANQAHQVLRVDFESSHAAEGLVEDGLIAAANRAMDEADVVILSDYLKGSLTERVVASILANAKTKGVLSAANPKPASAAFFSGAGLLSLNRIEIAALMGREPETCTQAQELAGEARRQLGVGCVLATMGDRGLAANWDGGTAEVVAPTVEVYDTAGAGDTVIAAAALGYARCGLNTDVFRFAVEASARVVRHVGVAVPSPQDLADMQTLD